MIKAVAVLFYLQVLGLLVCGYVHEGERIKKDEKISPALEVVKTLSEEDNSLGTSSSESDSNGNSDSANDSPTVVEDKGQEVDLESATSSSVSVEPNWFSSFENAEDYLDNWDSEDEANGGSTDPPEKDVVPSSEAMPSPVNSTEEEFSNVVYDRNGPIDSLDEVTKDSQLQTDEPERFDTVTEESEENQYHIKPYTVEPRFEDSITPQRPEASPSSGEEPKHVTTVGGTETWGDFSLDDFQGRKQAEESVSTEVIREPMRPVHRSAVPWLQRDVNQVGQPRQTVCQLELDRGLGPDEVSSWYYDSNEMRCRWFGYRGYGGNANRFASRAACEGYCVKDMENLCEAVRCSWTGTQCALVSDQPCLESARVYGRDWRTRCPPEQPVCMSRRSTRIAPDIDFRGIPLECLQDKDHGSCQRKNPSVMFHYDRERNDCMTFYFHDCGGNDNRFVTKSDCMTHCSP